MHVFTDVIQPEDNKVLIDFNSGTKLNKLYPKELLCFMNKKVWRSNWYYARWPKDLMWSHLYLQTPPNTSDICFFEQIQATAWSSPIPHGFLQYNLIVNRFGPLFVKHVLRGT